jgi:hypothetical protein
MFVCEYGVFHERDAVDDDIELPRRQFGFIERLIVFVADEELDAAQINLMPSVGAACDAGDLVAGIDTATGYASADFTGGA